MTKKDLYKRAIRLLTILSTIEDKDSSLFKILRKDILDLANDILRLGE